ncbi:hypothetical protein AURDEDRAFT_161016 [Auricularia subglabra TFB-10046 SS5]|nr:hypothetical protein AURDEDRAFT_161016 [Auricularia subglabra TFB-10046 SS5]
MSVAIWLWRAAYTWWARNCMSRRGLPTGWRVAEDRRDVFAEFCRDFIKEDLLLWARIALPASSLVSNMLAYYGETWDFLCDHDRLEAQNLLKGVKGAYLKAMDVGSLPN